MKKALLVILLLNVILSPAQNASDVAVQLTAVVQNNPPQITLNWAANATSSQYQVFRKLKNATSWGAPVSTLNGAAAQYIDNTVAVGTNYEYRVSRSAIGYSGNGYINTGIEVPEIAYRGKLLLLVDSSFITTLAPEIERLVDDIEGDGWEVIRHDVLRAGSVTHVKELIVNDFNQDTSFNVKAVFLLGHVPVPYSGNINPDGHSDHLGAWPADCYYGDVDGAWTDNLVSSTTASPLRTQNVPGDGKFDQSIVPGDVELQVGRVDLAGMPAFSLTEQQLLKNYLDKDHEYRKKLFSPLKQAVIDDNFGYFSGEAFAGSGYKNFAPLVGTANVSSGDYFTSMAGASYEWSFGCGGGSYTSASGIGTTANFAAASLQGVFTMLFGSYFGDWDAQNSFLKAPLAQGRVLTSVWSGRPHYQFHHMGLGENIGYDILVTQNNPGNLYYTSPTAITGKWVHNALMGDPTLRNDVVAPVSNVIATKSGYDCHVSWSASPEPNIIGYNIYMKNDTNTSYVKINAAPVTATTYTDYCLLYKGTYSYMVRTLKLENVPSGTYYNMSEGLADTAYNSSSLKVYANFTSFMNGSGLNLTNTSQNATTYYWDFGNGDTSATANPVVAYTSNGMYMITLIASNPCNQDTLYATVFVNEVGLKEMQQDDRIGLYPNPSQGSIRITSASPAKLYLEVFNAAGILVRKEESAPGEEIDLRELEKGLYLVTIRQNSSVRTRKLILGE